MCIRDSAEYAEYDGTPVYSQPGGNDRHDWYYSDAYRTIANIGLDYLCLLYTSNRRHGGKAGSDGTPVC